jgi:hypothetical protein
VHVKAVLLVVVTALIVGVVPAPAAAYYGSIGVYADPRGCDCDIVDAGGLIHVYIVHRDILTGVKGSRFTIGGYALNNLTYLYENPIGDPIRILGNIYDGFLVNYGDCTTGGLAIMEIAYFGSGLTPACSDLWVVAAPTAVTGEVEIFNCNDDVFSASGHGAYVNVDATCGCTNPYCTPVPVTESTWGNIKALYR